MPGGAFQYPVISMNMEQKFTAEHAEDAELQKDMQAAP